MLKMKNLINTFEAAKNQNEQFVFIGIEEQGVRQVICIPSESFDKKQEFYTKYYSNDLVHVMNSKVRIFSLNYGDESGLLEII